MAQDVTAVIVVSIDDDDSVPRLYRHQSMFGQNSHSVMELERGQERRHWPNSSLLVAKDSIAMQTRTNGAQITGRPKRAPETVEADIEHSADKSAFSPQTQGGAQLTFENGHLNELTGHHNMELSSSEDDDSSSSLPVRHDSLKSTPPTFRHSSMPLLKKNLSNQTQRAASRNGKSRSVRCRPSSIKHTIQSLVTADVPEWPTENIRSHTSLDTRSHVGDVCIGTTLDPSVAMPTLTTLRSAKSTRPSTVSPTKSRQIGSLLSPEEKSVSFSCHVCGREFGQLAWLEKHYKAHAEEQPIICEICGLSFSKRHGLIQHKRIHTNERPFTCTICHKGFRQRSTLKEHYRVHTGERPFVCEFCQRGFSQSSMLTTHRRIHTGEKPLICEFCGRGFSDHSHFSKHRRMHTGERPSECHLCGKTFIASSELTRHIRSHTGEKPFSCAVCKRQFSDRSHVRRHIRRQHNLPPDGKVVISALTSKNSAGLEKGSSLAAEQRNPPHKEEPPPLLRPITMAPRHALSSLTTIYHNGSPADIADSRSAGSPVVTTTTSHTDRDDFTVVTVEIIEDEPTNIRNRPIPLFSDSHWVQAQ